MRGKHIAFACAGLFGAFLALLLAVVLFADDDGGGGRVYGNMNLSSKVENDGEAQE